MVTATDVRWGVLKTYRAVPKSILPILPSIITGSPPTVMMMGSLALSNIFFTAMPVSVRVGPITAATWSTLMNFLAMVTVLVGSPSVSSMTSSRGRPLMPPSLLILSTAMPATSLVGVPIAEAGPEISKNAPIRMGSWAATGADRAMVRTATKRNSRFAMGSLLVRRIETI